MSVHRAFEKFNHEEVTHQHKLREASGIVNEMRVDVDLVYYDEPNTKPVWQLVVDIWNHTGVGRVNSHDVVYPKSLAEAEDRFNRIVIEYGLTEKLPKMESSA